MLGRCSRPQLENGARFFSDSRAGAIKLPSPTMSSTDEARLAQLLSSAFGKPQRPEATANTDTATPPRPVGSRTLNQIFHPCHNFSLITELMNEMSCCVWHAAPKCPTFMHIMSHHDLQARPQRRPSGRRPRASARVHRLAWCRISLLPLLPTPPSSQPCLPRHCSKLLSLSRRPF